MKKHPILDALQKASKGLVFTSETDAKLEPFVWQDDKLTRESVLRHAGAEAGTTVEQVTLDAFFRAVPREDRPKFDDLLSVLREQLSGAKVYKVGEEAEKAAYVVGRTQDGKLAGVKTTVVET